MLFAPVDRHRAVDDDQPGAVRRVFASRLAMDNFQVELDQVVDEPLLEFDQAGLENLDAEALGKIPVQRATWPS